MKSLTICIPTYRRPETLRRCIDSVVEQIQKFSLSDSINIYVTNDSSPDNTADVLKEFAHLSFFSFTTREKNYGMNLNIKCMLKEVAETSDYQLIITDDDCLQPNMLNKILVFLSDMQKSRKNVPVIWTPRYSYIEDGSLLCVVYKSFNENTYVTGTTKNVGKHMTCGHVLSGLIVKASLIDYDFWGEYEDNAYFPMILLGDLMYRYGAFYLNENVVHHTVLNECHWESWGKNEVTIKLKLFVDYLNSFDVFVERHLSPNKAFCFHLASFPTVYKKMHHADLFEKAKLNRRIYIQAISELRGGAHFRLNINKKMSLTVSVIISTLISLMCFFPAKILFCSFSSKRNKDRVKRILNNINTAFLKLELVLYWL